MEFVPPFEDSRPCETVPQRVANPICKCYGSWQIHGKYKAPHSKRSNSGNTMSLANQSCVWDIQFCRLRMNHGHTSLRAVQDPCYQLDVVSSWHIWATIKALLRRRDLGDLGSKLSLRGNRVLIRVWVKIKPPGIGVLVLGSIYQGYIAGTILLPTAIP